MHVLKVYVPYLNLNYGETEILLGVLTQKEFWEIVDLL